MSATFNPTTPKESSTPIRSRAALRRPTVNDRLECVPHDRLGQARRRVVRAARPPSRTLRHIKTTGAKHHRHPEVVVPHYAEQRLDAIDEISIPAACAWSREARTSPWSRSGVFRSRVDVFPVSLGEVQRRPHDPAGLPPRGRRAPPPAPHLSSRPAQPPVRPLEWPCGRADARRYGRSARRREPRS